MVKSRKKVLDDSVGAIIKSLSDNQRAMLHGRQFDMFDGPAIGTLTGKGKGPVIAALKRRGLVVGNRPYTRLTALGQRVVEALDA